MGKGMNRKLLVPICLVSVLGLLAGCGSGGGSTSSSAEPGSSSSGGSTSGTTSVTFDFWHTFGSKNATALEKKANEFSAAVKTATGVDVTINCVYQGGYSDILSKVTRGFAAGNIPTIAIAYPDHVANYLANEPRDGAYVYDLNDYVNRKDIGFGTQDYLDDEYDETDFVQAFYEEGQQYAKDGMYSLPYMKSSEVMFYNLEALCIAAPMYDATLESEAQCIRFIENISWDTFMDFCSFIAQHMSEILTTMEEPLFYDSDSNLFITKMYQEEVPYSSITDGVASIDFETGEARTKAEGIVQGVKDSYDAGALVTKGTEGTYGSDSFKNGKCMFTIGSSGGTGYVDPSGGSFTVRACKSPDSNDNPLYVSQGPTMTFLKNPSRTDAENDLRMEYAWQFAKFLTNADNNVEECIYGSEGYIPVRKSAYMTDAFNTFLEEGEIYAMSAKVLLEDIDGNYINAPVFKGSATLRDECGGAISDVCSGDKTATQAISTAINNAKLAM